MSGASAVSYTHLDVYKRQGYHVQISDFLLEELKKKYGDSNVKVVERVLKNF